MQTKAQSFIEANFNTFSGTIINWLAGMAIYPLFGLSVSALDVTGITLCFTVLSISRNYLVRRFFTGRDKVVTERKTYYLSNCDCLKDPKILNPKTKNLGNYPHPLLKELLNRETKNAPNKK
jgi:hypothetical protein